MTPKRPRVKITSVDDTRRVITLDDGTTWQVLPGEAMLVGWKKGQKVAVSGNGLKWKLQNSETDSTRQVTLESVSPIEMMALIARHKGRTGFSEIYHVTSFECVRETASGKSQSVLVEVFDAGPTVDPIFRYQCKATSDDGGVAYGNQASSIDTALQITHWGDLDGKNQLPPRKH